MEFKFIFTLNQINEIAACMSSGPYARVQKVLEEFSRQMQEQQQPPKAKKQ